MEKRLPGEDAKPLSGEAAEQWKKVKEGVSKSAKAAVTGDVEGLAVAFHKIRKTKLDMKQVLNALHVPEDADPYKEGITRILQRIPEGWGRWISCGPGWYGIITKLDEKLAEIDPDYQVHQVKEKFGGLCYYFDASSKEGYDAMDKLVAAAEHEAEQTCEECGAPGALCTTSGTTRGWYKTVCPKDGQEQGYKPISMNNTGIEA